MLISGTKQRNFASMGSLTATLKTEASVEPLTIKDFNPPNLPDLQITNYLQKSSSSESSSSDSDSPNISTIKLKKKMPAKRLALG